MRKVDQHQWGESMNLYGQKVKIGESLERNKMEKMKMEVGGLLGQEGMERGGGLTALVRILLYKSSEGLK